MNEVVKVRKGNLKRKLFATALAGVISLSSLTVSAQAGTITNPDVYINDQIVTIDKSQLSFVENGVTYVPLKATLSSKGYGTYYDATRGTINSSSEFGSVVVKNGEKEFTANGKKYEAPAPVKIIDGTTYVPVYVISMTLRANTEYNDEGYNVNFVINQKQVNKDRVDSLNKVIDKNSNLTYSERSTIKTYVSNYFALVNPDLDEYNRMLDILSRLDIETKYNGTNKPFYTVSKGLVTINGSRTSTINSNDLLRNALTSMFNGSNTPLLKYGMTELISAEANKDNTNQDYDLVLISKMLCDLVGRDVMLDAFKNDDMSKVKETLMGMYDDETLYSEMLRLINNIQSTYTVLKTSGSNATKNSYKLKKDHEDDVMYLYAILDTFYTGKTGKHITEDDIMEGYYRELLFHGDKKAFKKEPRIFNDDLIDDYVTMYRVMQSGYNYGYSSYNYYYSRRPLELYQGNGQVLILK